MRQKRLASLLLAGTLAVNLLALPAGAAADAAYTAELQQATADWATQRTAMPGLIQKYPNSPEPYALCAEVYWNELLREQDQLDWQKTQQMIAYCDKAIALGTRACPALVEAMPGDMIEMSRELAEEKGIKQGDKVRVWNRRASVVVTAVVTPRLRPLTVDGKTQHLIGLTHHYSWAKLYGKTTHGAVNDLTPNVGDPNSQTPEYKAFLVNIEKTKM